MFVLVSVALPMGTGSEHAALTQPAMPLMLLPELPPASRAKRGRWGARGREREREREPGRRSKIWRAYMTC